MLSACRATDIDSSGSTANGFTSCVYGSALYTDEATNPTNTYMDSSDAQTTPYSAGGIQFT
jgi:hypothetical protein